MKNNSFKKWIPHKDVDEVYDITKIGFQKDEGFIVLLVPDNLEHNKRSNHLLKLTWDDVLSYQVTQESYRPDVWISNQDEVWTFYISESSGYLQNFLKDNILAPEKTYHFFIGGTNFIIDIISDEYPKVTFVK